MVNTRLGTSGSNRSLSLIVVSVLIGLLVVGTGFLFYRTQVLADEQAKSQADGIWQCGSVACAKTVDPQVWVTKNCGLVSGPNSTQELACNIPGAPGPVPLQQINMTAVGKLCDVYSCVQEVRVRAVNYTLNITPQ